MFALLFMFDWWSLDLKYRYSGCSADLLATKTSIWLFSKFSVYKTQQSCDMWQLRLSDVIWYHLF